MNSEKDEAYDAWQAARAYAKTLPDESPEREAAEWAQVEAFEKFGALDWEDE